MTSFFVQVSTPPQCAQVTFCVFNLAIGQRFASIVLPVSVSFDVEGQRTSRLLRLGPGFDFGRRGGSKKNRVAIIRVGKRCALWRCRKATSPFLPGPRL